MPRTIVSGIFVLALLCSSLPARAEQAGWLGVRIGQPRAVQAPDGEPETRQGVELAGIFTDSPAVEAGLRARDLVLAVDGVAVASAAAFAHEIQRQPPRSWLALTVYRGDEERTLRVRLDDRPDNVSGLRLLRGWVGLEAIELPPTLRDHFGAPSEAGVMVALVEPGSPAEVAGFELGDVVYELDGEPIRSVAELRGRVASAGVGNDAEFTLARSGSEIVLETRIDAAPPGQR